MRFRFRCAGCGEVTIPGQRVELVMTDRRACWFSFRCPVCATPNGPRPLSRVAADILIARGAMLELQDRPRLAVVPAQSRARSR